MSVSRMMIAGKKAKKIRNEIAEARVANWPLTIDSAKNAETYQIERPCSPGGRTESKYAMDFATIGKSFIFDFQVVVSDIGAKIPLL